ncbi:MAG: hypothetical protein WBI76_05405 [Dethiobacteria bacterium]|jgi:hypothetical protein
MEWSMIMMHDFRVFTGWGIYKVEALVILTGPDLVVIFGGGEKYHIGASALSIPRESFASKNSPSASASVLCVTGHKDDELARAAALKLAAKYSCTVNVIVGLHINRATIEDIDQLVDCFYDCLSLIERRLDEHFNQ